MSYTYSYLNVLTTSCLQQSTFYMPHTKQQKCANNIYNNYSPAKSPTPHIRVAYIDLSISLVLLSWPTAIISIVCSMVKTVAQLV